MVLRAVTAALDMYIVRFNFRSETASGAQKVNM